jgi:ABC-type nitrate/sulfonate/bicarbonate transport system permease component
MAPRAGREATLAVADPLEPPSPLGLDAADPLAGDAIGKRRPTKPLLLLAASVVVLLLVQLASLEFPAYVVPDVPTIAAATWQLLTEQSGEMLATLWRFALAMAAAIVGGWAIGLVMGSQRRIGEFGEAMTRILLATPALSIILFVVLWFRSVEVRVFVVALVIAMPFYIIAVYEGVKAIDAEMVEAVRQFRPTRTQMFRLVLLPHSIANVIMATKSVAGFTLRIVVFAEVIAATSGVGSSMLRAQGNFRIDLIFGWTVILVVFNFVLMALLERAERALLRWRPENAVG